MQVDWENNFFLGESVKKDTYDNSAYATEPQLDWVLGCSFFIRRAVLETVGLLPEEYFLYYEYVAYSRMAVAKGFSLGWAEESYVYHKEGGATGAKGGSPSASLSRSAYVDYLIIRNRFYLMRTLHPWLTPFALLSLTGVFYNRLCRGQLERLPLLMRAAIDGLFQKMGKPVFFQNDMGAAF